jgi:hypothetical protein
LDRWRSISQNPVVVESTDQDLQLLWVARFCQKRICSEGVRSVDISDLRRAAQDNHQQTSHVALVTNPGKHLEPIPMGHIEIEQKDSWKGMSLPVAVRRFTPQVSNSFSTRPDNPNRIHNPGFLEGVLEKKQIVRVILRDQD